METLTLQFGPQANFVGSHFWNFDDEGWANERLNEVFILGDLSFRYCNLSRIVKCFDQAVGS